MMLRIATLLVSVAYLPVVASAGGELGPDQMALLQDAGGWEYVSMDDSQNGFPTQHTCFDGSPHPETCRGTLTLTAGKAFVQKVYINQQAVSRQGTYELTGDQLVFYDEFGTRDGPYRVAIDTPNKRLSMEMPQVKIKLLLYKEYRKQLAAQEKKRRAAELVK